MMEQKNKGKQETGINEIKGRSKIYSLDDYPDVKNKIHELYLTYSRTFIRTKITTNLCIWIKRIQTWGSIKSS